MVSARIPRRRLARRLVEESRVPDRFDRSIVGGPLGRQRRTTGRARTRPASAQPMTNSYAIRSPRAPLLAPIRRRAPRSRIRSRLPARHSGKWRPIHPRRDLARLRTRRARRWRARRTNLRLLNPSLRAFPAAEASARTTPHASSRMRWGDVIMRSPPVGRSMEVGVGIRGPLRGCGASASKPFLGYEERMATYARRSMHPQLGWIRSLGPPR